jgi:hypothetical protein
MSRVRAPSITPIFVTEAHSKHGAVRESGLIDLIASETCREAPGVRIPLAPRLRLAVVVKLADTSGLSPDVERRAGSTPADGTASIHSEVAQLVERWTLNP